MKQLLDVRWLTNHRLLRSKPFLSAAREQLSNQVQATLERSCRSTTKVNADRLHASASDFQGQLSRSENCDDLIRAYRLLHRWIQVLPSELESSEQAVLNRALFGAYFTQAGLQTCVSELLGRYERVAALRQDAPPPPVKDDSENCASVHDDPDVANICCRTDRVDMDRFSFSIFPTECDVVDVVDACIEDATSFAEEKFGNAPEIELVFAGEANATKAHVNVVAPYLYFSVMETLKNSIVATAEQFGTLDIQDAPPIQVVVQSGASNSDAKPSAPKCRVVTLDSGSGLAYPGLAARMWDFHFTTRPENRRIDEERVLDQWRDSRAHGSAIAGQGIGLPRARVMAAFNNSILAHEPRLDVLVGELNQMCQPGAAASANIVSTQGVRVHDAHKTAFRLDIL